MALSFRPKGIMLKLIIYAFLIVSLQAISQPMPNTVRVCLMDTELYPLWRKPGNETLPNPGVNIELQQYIADELGHRIDWVRAPFARCLALLRQNEVDLVNVASYNADRERYGHYPKKDGQLDIERHFKRESYFAFRLPESEFSWDGKSFSNPSKLPIAIEIGASIRTFLNEKEIAVYEVSRASQAFGMLTRGRVVAVVTNQFQSIEYQSDAIEVIQPAVSNKEYYIMISKQFYGNYPEYSEQIWTLSGLIREKHFVQLLEHYSDEKEWR